MGQVAFTIWAMIEKVTITNHHHPLSWNCSRFYVLENLLSNKPIKQQQQSNWSYPRW